MATLRRSESRDDLRVDLAEARAALAEAAARTASLLRSAPDPARRVRRSEWSVGEVGAHLALGLLAFIEALGGDDRTVGPYLGPGTFAERLAAVTSGTLELEASRDPGTLAALILERVDAFLVASRSMAADEVVPTPWYGPGAGLPVATVTALLVGEQLVHGWDLAMTLGRAWPVAVPEAHLVIRMVTSMMPLAANPATTSGLRAVFGVAVRQGGPRFVVAVDRGTVTVEPWGSRPVDCHLSAHPVALMLVGYGRIGQWAPIARGRLSAWGRRPWLALRFTNLFYNP